MQCIEAIGLRSCHGISLRVRLKSVPVVSDCEVAAECRRSQKAHLESTSVLDQKGEQSHAENHQPASDSTSSFSALRCSKSSFCTSSATSSSLYSEFRCCTDRLRSPTLTGHSTRDCQVAEFSTSAFSVSRHSDHRINVIAKVRNRPRLCEKSRIDSQFEVDKKTTPFFLSLREVAVVALILVVRFLAK